MRFILITLFFLLILSCDDDITTPNNQEISDEIDTSICNECIWVQNDCNGNWFIGYNINSPIAGIQFDVEGVSLISASGGAAEEAGLSITLGPNTIIGFSFSGNTIPAGSGKLLEIDFEGDIVSITNIIFATLNAEELNINYHGIINCTYYSSLQLTGESQLTILNNTITNLEIGDEIGIFDLDAITNYNDCTTEKGELLVGSGIWTGEQLNIVSVGSVDLCNINGVQLSGYIEGNPLIIKIYRPKNGLEYLTEISWDLGLGYFGEIIQSINNITLMGTNN